MDCTVGPGGMAARILKVCAPTGRLIAIDQDPQALERARETLNPYIESVSFHCGNFQDLASILDTVGCGEVNGVLFDLGISSMQLDDVDRGFSFQQEGPLDMRMSPSKEITAAEIVNTLPEKELANVIYEFGEERLSRRIAKAIVKQRTIFPFRTTSELANVIQQSVPSAYRYGRLHPATRTFQALRIVVNNELAAITPALHEAAGRLAPSGRLCVISFHSLEDRLVKYTFRTLSEDSNRQLRILTKKPCMASPEERKRNHRSRSAKLRVLEKHSDLLDL